jgi:hypothetical protein
MKSRQALKILRKHVSRARYDRGGWYRQRTFNRACRACRACRVYARSMRLSEMVSEVPA